MLWDIICLQMSKFHERTAISYFFQQTKGSIVKQFTQRSPILLVMETRHWKLHSHQLGATTCSRITAESSLGRQAQKTPSLADFHKDSICQSQKTSHEMSGGEKHPDIFLLECCKVEGHKMPRFKAGKKKQTLMLSPTLLLLWRFT